jgi:hypothetical protein
MSYNPSYNPYAQIEAQYQAHYGHTGFNQVAYQDENTGQVKSLNITPPYYQDKVTTFYNSAYLDSRNVNLAFSNVWLNPGSFKVVNKEGKDVTK